jgi:hypothetical protein
MIFNGDVCHIPSSRNLNLLCVGVVFLTLHDLEQLSNRAGFYCSEYAVESVSEIL